MTEAQIEIKCPKCSLKALFKSSWNKDSYILHPQTERKVICSNCGYNGSKEFSSKDYYYQFPVKDRVLYARTLKNLVAIRDFFQDDKKISEPELDFPKVFYEYKEEIIKKINYILKTEPCCS